MALTWANDEAAGRISLHLVAVEAIAEADIENAGHHYVFTRRLRSIWRPR